MSQPVGIILKVKMRPGAFSKYIKAEAHEIARLMLDLLETSEEGDYYMFKYIKRSETLYSYIYYDHGDKEWIERSPFYPLFLDLEKYLESGSEGYLLGTLDASSPWKKERAEFDYLIRNGNYLEEDMSEALFEQVKKDCDIFFSRIDKGLFYDLLEEGDQMVDRGIHTQYKKLKEDRRRRHVLENLHTATSENPLLLFGNWKYDGNNLLSRTGEKYSQFNVRELRETPYGVTDGRYILATTYDNVLQKSYDLVLETDHAKFKRLARGESTTYFKSDETVYNSHLEPIPEADASTFKIIAELVAADRNYIYLRHMADKRVPVSELGEPYRLDLPYNYSAEEILLIGSRKIYVGCHPVEDVDAATFELLPHSDLPEKVASMIPLYTWNMRTKDIRRWRCRDKDGEFYILIHVHDMVYYPQYVRKIPGLPLSQPVVVRV